VGGRRRGRFLSHVSFSSVKYSRLSIVEKHGSSQKFLGINQDHKILYVWNGGKDGQIETIAYWVVKRESRSHLRPRLSC
jgi:hypothetical protein